MPPKRKKVGRPKGTRNKKVLGKVNGKYLAKHIKKEGELPSSSQLTKDLTLIKGYSGDIVTKPIIGCKECNKKFRFKTSYIRHLRNEHSKVAGSVACNQCSVRCPDKQTLKQHITNIHEREIFKCPHCEKEFVRHSHVLRHLSQKGCDGRGVSTYPCEICKAEFSRKDNLMVHLRLQHIMRKDYSCKHCTYATRTFSKLIIHMQTHSAVPPQYECDHCGKSCSSRAAIAKHLEIHGEKKFACDVCGYNTFTIEVMRRHVLTHVKEKPYKCPQCPLSFIQRVQLQRHMDRHTGNVCAVCDTTFGTKHHLVVHMKEEHKPHMQCPFMSCPLSKETVTDQVALDLHIQSHDDKRYGCEVCTKRFSSELNMRRHVLSHTLERPRRCMYCVSARAYVRGQQLVRHVRKAHAAVFREHLSHVRTVLGINPNVERVKKSELEAVLNVLDAEADRILQGYGEGVLYGGMQEVEETVELEVPPAVKEEKSALMMEVELAESLNKLLSQLIDKDMLECFGWPHESVDTVLEKVIENCGARAADREKWTRVQCLRENAKHLFLYVVEDKTVARMLHTHTIDQIVNHILAQVTDGEQEGSEIEDSK